MPSPSLMPPKEPSQPSAAPFIPSLSLPQHPAQATSPLM
jgi:hypothetical protein